MSSDERLARDRQLIEALDQHLPVGERYARSGEVPVTNEWAPSIRPSPETALIGDPTPVQPRLRPRRRGGWRVVQVAIALALIGVVYYGVSVWQVWSTGNADDARSVDAIVVLGAAQYDGRPSPQLAARLDHVVELWDDGLSPRVVVTGGNREGDRFTEAEASAQYLADRGVPESAMVLEDAGTNTFDSLMRARALLDDDVDTVLLVTDPYHALRSRLTAREVGFTAYVSATPESVVSGAAETRRVLAEAAGVAIGRVIGFERLSGLTD